MLVLFSELSKYKTFILKKYRHFEEPIVKIRMGQKLIKFLSVKNKLRKKI